MSKKEEQMSKRCLKNFLLVVLGMVIMYLWLFANGAIVLD